MSVYRDIYEEIAHSTARQRSVDGPLYRLMKIQEEAGEVAAALIGFTGTNARKGYSHTDADVAKELADVVITAMVALHDWVPSPERFMKERLQVLTERIRNEGS